MPWHKNRGRGGGGRGNWRGRGGGGGGGRGGGNRFQRDDRQSQQQIKRENERLQGYYDKLDVIPEGEKEEFWESLRSDLPNSFRFAGSKGHALAVRKSLIDRYIPQIQGTTYQGEAVEPPFEVKWIPGGMAWAMTTPKQVIRKQPQFAAFQKFLVSENSVGNISRQELVSMIPPLFIDLKPWMTCLDMCAAPGSKSGQLIEMLHDGEEARIRATLDEIAESDGRPRSPRGLEVEASGSTTAAWPADQPADDGRPTGLLIANDNDYKRAQMLVHQTKRLNSPNVIVTNHDATLLPSIKVPGANNAYLKFDRVLADVPCSGDGTLRKNLAIWREWSPASAIGLHKTQTDILVRALQLLKPGGRVVYSTCSMNPIENEAVLQHSINRVGGLEYVNIIDVSTMLPELKRRPGLKTWKVMDASFKWYGSWEDVEEQLEFGDKTNASKLHRQMFPDPSKDYPLDRAVRVYPHLQDTGGFFICVLEKKKNISATKPAELSTLKKERPITKIIKEISQSDVASGEHIKAVDEIAPSTGKPELSDAMEPAAVRQNESDIPSDVISGAKRSLDYDPEQSSKRVKVESHRSDSSEPQIDTNGTDTARVDESAALSTPTSDTRQSLPNSPHLNGHSHQSQAQLKKAANQTHEEPFKYLEPDHPELEEVYKFYNLSPRFPRDRFMVRNAQGEPAKAIYYTSQFARELLEANEGKGIKFIHCGVKMFVKQDVQSREEVSKWRIQTEGLPIVEGWVGEKRILRLSEPKVLQILLREMFPRVAGDEFKRFGELGEHFRTLGMGCAVLRCEPGEATDGSGFSERLALPLWRGISSVNVMLPKEERKAMLLRLFDDDSNLVDHSQQDREEKMAAKKQRELDEAATAAEEAERSGQGAGAYSKGRTGQELDVGSGPGEPAEVAREASAQELASAGMADSLASGEDAVAGEVQNLTDQGLGDAAAAPGADGESSAFNRTV